ncbi:amino acid permease [Kutzneria sp. 744]|uniref:amino acid permease n=1 Tax=Kutzneria sp. (strain 744) TaxID=345341 RepID=UPI0003EEB53C|nr:amino acid permease [Kutzneria sp. 744]EWM10482.1 cationic amino acid transporter [Kutzneria sp. 744]
MTQMCGVGPLVTIPFMVADAGGPQAVFGWIVGAIIALADGLIWAELGASLPGAGGTYIYLREASQYRTGRLMPFLFVWTAILHIPLTMAGGIIGLVSHLGALAFTYAPGTFSSGGPFFTGLVLAVYASWACICCSRSAFSACCPGRRWPSRPRSPRWPCPRRGA